MASGGLRKSSARKLLLFFSPAFFSRQKVEEKNVGEKNKNCPVGPEK
jgi:hypothetical protein